MKPLLDEIADNIVDILMDESIGRSEAQEPFYDTRAKYKAMAQAAIDVVERRLLSNEVIEITIAKYVNFRDLNMFVEGLDDVLSYVVSSALNAAKEGSHE
jgi:hypothetical protein